MERIQSGIFILYVADQAASAQFYEQVFDQKPVLHVPGMTEFQVLPQVKIGIMPEKGIARIICPVAPHPESGRGIPRSELYLYVRNPEEYMERAVAAGAVLVSELQKRDWGDEAGYLLDPDGHILAFAKT